MPGPISPTAHWRDSARVARFWIFDSRAVFPLVLLILHIRLWTIIVAVLTTFFFYSLERYGFTVPVFLRWLRSSLAGKRKISSPWWKE